MDRIKFIVVGVSPRDEVICLSISAYTKKQAVMLFKKVLNYKHRVISVRSEA